MYTYDINNVCAFSKAKDIWGQLGNMTGGFPLKISDNIIAPSVENLYQSIRFTNHPDIQEHIINQKSGFGAKLVSKKYTNNTRHDFDDIKIRVMKFCLQLKKKQHKLYRDTLILTDNKPIVELSHKDTFWGAVYNDNALIGNNNLGILHQLIRSEIIDNNIDKIDDPNIIDFTIIGFNLNLLIQ